LLKCCCRADAALSAHTNDLSRRLQKAAADAEAAAAAAAWEREQKVGTRPADGLFAGRT
jgi:hypothetical protein